MNYNFDENYQYDSCTSRGICSVNPRISSLQEVLILYLKVTGHYALKLCEKGYFNEKARNIILNTISIMVSNFEFSENDFEALVSGFNNVLPEIISEYENVTGESFSVPDDLKQFTEQGGRPDIIKAIRLGEQEFLKKSAEIPDEIRDLYKVLFVLAKSICINILDLETFGINTEDGFLSILKLLNSLNAESQDIEKLKDLIEFAANTDNKLMQNLQTAKEERYGRQRPAEVSYTTTPAKAILVAGSNIRELEDVLEAVKDKDIDVYTHDEMVIANTFPKFSEYKNLKGQYGQGIENCLLDFATFPGPIILTKHSLYNVEHLYRGRLYTTDFANTKGIIRIKDKDFSEVIKSAIESKGFKTGRQCETVNIGFDLEAVINEIKDKINRYSRIFIIGAGAYTLEQKSYFEKLMSLIPEDVLVISLSYCIQRENIICINACFDSFAITRLTDALQEKITQPVTVFFPICGRHTISQMVWLQQKSNIKIYIGKCTPILLNPNIITTFQKVFGIEGLTSAKNDLESIFS